MRYACNRNHTLGSTAPPVTSHPSPRHSQRVADGGLFGRMLGGVGSVVPNCAIQLRYGCLGPPTSPSSIYNPPPSTAAIESRRDRRSPRRRPDQPPLRQSAQIWDHRFASHSSAFLPRRPSCGGVPSTASHCRLEYSVASHKSTSPTNLLIDLYRPISCKDIRLIQDGVRHVPRQRFAQDAP